MSEQNQIQGTPTEWEETSPEAVAAAYAAHQKVIDERRSRGATIKMDEPGEYIFRGLPPIKGTGAIPVHTDWIHYLRNPYDPGAKGKPCRCPKKALGKHCRGCTEVSALYRKAGGDKALLEIAKGMSSRETHLMGVMVLACPEAMRPKLMKLEGSVYVPTEPKILVLPTTVYEPLFDPRDGKGIFFSSEGGGDFTNPRTGFNLIIHRTGKERDDTRYTVKTARASTPLKNMDWLKQLKPLDKAFEDLTDAQMNALLEGRADDAPGGDTSFDHGANVAGADRQLGPAPGAMTDMVEDPLLGEQVTRDELHRRMKARGEAV